jgi:hypothetical protein
VAGWDTNHTVVAPLAIDFSSLFRGERYSPLRAGGNAGAAPFTENIPDHEFWKGVLGFGVGTPQAVQWTALKKYRGPYAGSVMDAEFLDVKNEARVPAV